MVTKVKKISIFFYMFFFLGSSSLLVQFASLPFLFSSSSSLHLFHSHSRFPLSSFCLSCCCLQAIIHLFLGKEFASNHPSFIFISYKFMFSSLIFYIYIRILHFRVFFCLFYVNKLVNFNSFWEFYLWIFS